MLYKELLGCNERLLQEDEHLNGSRGSQLNIIYQWFGKLGCIVCSKMTGIGEAELMWKANKKTRGGPRCRLSTDKTKKQATISRAHSVNKSMARNSAARC
jgi:hypothetical protein